MHPEPLKSAVACARSDLEKAIAAHGGPAELAKRMGWQLKYKNKKPRGYWDSIPNVQRDIDEFIATHNMRPGEC